MTDLPIVKAGVRASLPSLYYYNLLLTAFVPISFGILLACPLFTSHDLYDLANFQHFTILTWRFDHCLLRLRVCLPEGHPDPQEIRLGQTYVSTYEIWLERLLTPHIGPSRYRSARRCLFTSNPHILSITRTASRWRTRRRAFAFPKTYIPTSSPRTSMGRDFLHFDGLRQPIETSQASKL